MKLHNQPKGMMSMHDQQKLTNMDLKFRVEEVICPDPHYPCIHCLAPLLISYCFREEGVESSPSSCALGSGLQKLSANFFPYVELLYYYYTEWASIFVVCPDED